MQKNQHKLDTLSKRLVYALELTGTKKADLAKAIDVKPQVIQFLCTSSTRSSRFTFEIATALGLNTRWLAIGEGEMFLADDPKYKLFNQYKRIPILTTEQLLLKAHNKTISVGQLDWTALKTTKENLFCTKIADVSMEPYFPANSLIFFAEDQKYSPCNKDIALIFIPEYNAVVLREISIENSDIFMVPKNTDLFKKTALSNSAKILGTAIECHWTIKR